MKKLTGTFIVITLILWMGQSCTRQPFACYSTDVSPDSFYVMQPITFYASCSNDADSYYWEFYGNEDSTEYGYSVTKTFKNPGKVKVFLLVTGKSKTASASDSIIIHP